jgi:hypothetical protein
MLSVGINFQCLRDCLCPPSSGTYVRGGIAVHCIHTQLVIRIHGMKSKFPLICHISVLAGLVILTIIKLEEVIASFLSLFLPLFCSWTRKLDSMNNLCKHTMNSYITLHNISSFPSKSNIFYENPIPLLHIS